MGGGYSFDFQPSDTASVQRTQTPNPSKCSCFIEGNDNTEHERPCFVEGKCKESLSEHYKNHSHLSFIFLPSSIMTRHCNILCMRRRYYILLSLCSCMHSCFPQCWYFIPLYFIYIWSVSSDKGFEEGNGIITDVSKDKLSPDPIVESKYSLYLHKYRCKIVQ